MTTIDTKKAAALDIGEDVPLYKKYKAAHHFRSATEEFDAVKLGFWLFLTTEILLFAGIFVGYAIFRTWYPEAWAEGSGMLDWRWGGLNTIVLLISSYTMATAIFSCQTGRFKRMRI